MWIASDNKLRERKVHAAQRATGEFTKVKKQSESDEDEWHGWWDKEGSIAESDEAAGQAVTDATSWYERRWFNILPENWGENFPNAPEQLVTLQFPVKRQHQKQSVGFSANTNCEPKNKPRSCQGTARQLKYFKNVPTNKSRTWSKWVTRKSREVSINYG